MEKPGFLERKKPGFLHVQRANAAPDYPARGVPVRLADRVLVTVITGWVCGCRKSHRHVMVVRLIFFWNIFHKVVLTFVA
jgi:hypothetical protein